MSLNLLTPLKENWACSIPISPVLQVNGGGEHGMLKVPGSPFPKNTSCYRPTSSMATTRVAMIHNSTHREHNLSEADEPDCDSGIITFSTSVETSAFETHMDTSGGRLSTSPSSSPLCPPTKKFCRLNLTGLSSPTFSHFEAGAFSSPNPDMPNYRRRSSTRRLSGNDSRAGHHPIFGSGAQLSTCASTPSPVTSHKRLPNFRNPFLRNNDTPIADPQPPVNTDDHYLFSLDESRPARLSEINQRRFDEEFVELADLSGGRFGTTYLVRHRLDGRHYCIKKLQVPFACGSGLQQRLLKEVFALAAVEHSNLVRYFSAWAETGALFIQLEFCAGGSLAQAINRGELLNTEPSLVRLLLHTCRGLRHLHHSSRMAHLDVKPANVLIQRGHDSQPVYKLGDFGHITSLDRDDAEVDEGDSRYLAREILERPFGSDGDSPAKLDLCRADIFSLGLTVFAAATGVELPNNGPDWTALRTVGLPPIQTASLRCYNILRAMTDPLPRNRPTAIHLCSMYVIKLSFVCFFNYFCFIYFQG